jgi:hypothetical protein
MARKTSCLASIVLTIAGCGGSEEPTAQASERAPPAAPPRETVFDPLTSTIGRAEGVQQTVDDQAAEQRRRIDEASR